MADQPTRVTVRSAVTTAGVTSAALILAAAAALPAFADNDNDNADSAHTNSGNHYGQTKEHSNHANGGASNDSTASDEHNPPGNNGTVKIHDDYGDTAHHNVPHVDCDFAVAFWGFDADQTLTVSFAGQAPTGKDTPLTVTGASTSITSPDDAGGGQDYDNELDFTADQLNLASLGDPHPQQGYHIKLTVNTYEPGGYKYKVFWLQPCATVAPAQTSATTTTDTPEQTSVLGTTVTKTPTTSSGNAAEAATATKAKKAAAAPTEVLGQHFSRSNSGAAPSAASLPFTGAEIGGMGAAAALLLGAGTALTVAGRRRRAGSVSES